MLLHEVIENIRALVNSNDDNQGKSANSLYSNKLLVFELQSAIAIYANFTGAIEDVYSTFLNKKNRFVATPDDVVRRTPYRTAHVFHGTAKHSLKIVNNPVKMTNNFPYNTTTGIPEYCNLWNGKFYIYPGNDQDASSTTLSSAASEMDTTINVASTTGFIPENGRITIGTEKILYAYKTDISFVGCERGVEKTSATTHTSGKAVTENNLEFRYRRHHWKITVGSNDVIFTSHMNKKMEVADEHLPAIINWTAYNLLNKVDASRAAQYKMDSQQFLQMAKQDIDMADTDQYGGYFIEI